MKNLARKDGPALLNRPVHGRMLGHVPVEDSSRADVEHDEDVEDTEAGGDDGEEVTGEDRVCAILTNVVHRCEGRPPRGDRRPGDTTDRARRDG